MEPEWTIDLDKILFPFIQELLLNDFCSMAIYNPSIIFLGQTDYKDGLIKKKIEYFNIVVRCSAYLNKKTNKFITKQELFELLDWVSNEYKINLEDPIGLFSKMDYYKQSIIPLNKWFPFFWGSNMPVELILDDTTFLMTLKLERENDTEVTYKDFDVLNIININNVSNITDDQFTKIWDSRIIATTNNRFLITGNGIKPNYSKNIENEKCVLTDDINEKIYGLYYKFHTESIDEKPNTINIQNIQVSDIKPLIKSKKITSKLDKNLCINRLNEECLENWTTMSKRNLVNLTNTFGITDTESSKKCLWDTNNKVCHPSTQQKEPSVGYVKHYNTLHGYKESLYSRNKRMEKNKDTDRAKDKDTDRAKDKSLTNKKIHQDIIAPCMSYSNKVEKNYSLIYLDRNPNRIFSPTSNQEGILIHYHMTRSNGNQFLWLPGDYEGNLDNHTDWELIEPINSDYFKKYDVWFNLNIPKSGKSRLSCTTPLLHTVLTAFKPILLGVAHFKISWVEYLNEKLKLVDGDTKQLKTDNLYRFYNYTMKHHFLNMFKLPKYLFTIGKDSPIEFPNYINSKKFPYFYKMACDDGWVQNNSTSITTINFLHISYIYFQMFYTLDINTLELMSFSDFFVFSIEDDISPFLNFPMGLTENSSEQIFLSYGYGDTKAMLSSWNKTELQKACEHKIINGKGLPFNKIVFKNIDI